MIAVCVVQMTVVKMIHVTCVLDGCVTAAGGVLMLVRVRRLGARFLAASGTAAQSQSNDGNDRDDEFFHVEVDV